MMTVAQNEQHQISIITCKLLLDLQSERKKPYTCEIINFVKRNHLYKKSLSLSAHVRVFGSHSVCMSVTELAVT